WRMRYRNPATGKESMLTFGDYPAVPLARARAERARVDQLLAQGEDPVAQRQEDAQAQKAAADRQFQAVAAELLKLRRPAWSDGYHARISNTLKNDAYPYFGTHAVDEIPGKMVLDAAKRIEARGAPDMADRFISATSMVFQYAVGTGRAPADPTQGLKRFLDPRAPVKHFPHVDEASLGKLITRVRNYHGRPETRIAMQIMMHTFPRTNELRWAAWTEFHTDDALWRIPAGRMKGTLIAKETGADHVIPLSRQVLALLAELGQYTGRYRLLFPGLRDPANTPMSAETINKALKILGFEGEQTGHGFRGLASTIMNERSGARAEVIERQLAHKERNMVRRAYNHAEYLDERRQLMQWWSDYLDSCASDAGK
ncbi:MAG: tyrosine-type recombinase/integrase, partial [Alcaligenes sp.]